MVLDIELFHPIEAYLNFIGGARYKKSGFFNETRYFSSSHKKICIYDKIKEVKKDRFIKIPKKYSKNHPNPLT